MRRMFDAAKQLKAKKGPYYLRWLWAMQAALEREDRRRKGHGRKD